MTLLLKTPYEDPGLRECPSVHGRGRAVPGDTCQATEIAGLLPIHYYHHYLMFFKGQSQNKWSTSQGSNTSLYHRRWRPLWYLGAVTWAIFLSDSINLARLPPPAVFPQSPQPPLAILLLLLPLFQ